VLDDRLHPPYHLPFLQRLRTLRTIAHGIGRYRQPERALPILNIGIFLAHRLPQELVRLPKDVFRIRAKGPRRPDLDTFDGDGDRLYWQCVAQRWQSGEAVTCEYDWRETEVAYGLSG
jgi:hypothetical protein